MSKTLGAPSVSFLVSYRKISNALSGQFFQVHQMISHMNRTNNYSSRRDSSLSFYTPTPLVSF